MINYIGVYASWVGKYVPQENIKIYSNSKEVDKIINIISVLEDRNVEESYQKNNSSFKT